MKFLPENKTMKKIATYSFGAVAVGAVVGMSYFGYINQIPVSAFTDAQLATAANLGTYGTAIVGTGAKIATFTAAQFTVATGYGVAFVAALSGSVFGAFKAAQFAVQQCAKLVKSTKKAPEKAPEKASEKASEIVSEKNPPHEMSDSSLKRSCDDVIEASTEFAAMMAARAARELLKTVEGDNKSGEEIPASSEPEAEPATPSPIQTPSPTYNPRRSRSPSKDKQVPNLAEVLEANIVKTPRAHIPRNVLNIS